MFNFKSFLSEEETVKPTKLGHLTHAHRMMFNFAKQSKDQNGNPLPQSDEERSMGGHAGIATTDEHLNYLHNYLRGAKIPAGVTVSEKMEGAPSFLIKKNGGVVSVGYKGAAGKEDKLASTHEDIDRLYGHAPGLADKMHRLLDHGGKMLPDSPKIYQGDYMGDDSEVKTEKGQHTTQPNSVKYHLGKDTPEGMKAKRAKVLLSLHTQYGPNGAEPIDKKTRESFIDHPDVHHMDPTIRVNPQNYTPEEQAQFASHMAAARQEYSKMKPEADDFLRRHGNDIESHINASIRQGVAPSVEGFIQHLNAKSAKKIESLKSEKGRDAESRKHADTIQDVVDNQHHLKSALALAQHFQNAQEVLRKVAAKNSPYMTTINGQPTEPEGLVIAKKNKDKTTSMTKVVNPDFTSFNLQGGGNISQAQKQPIKEESEGMTSKSVVAHFGKWRIPHRGYDEVANKVADVARKTGSDSEIALSGASNPLPFESKVQHARNMIPQANITSTKHKNYLEHAADLNRRGYNTLHMVVGSDRAEEFKSTLEKYNGRPDKSGRILYHFPGGIHIHVAGKEREEGATGVTGSSSSNQERYARAGDYNSFAANAPASANPKHVKAMYDEIRSNLKEETDTTPAADAPSVAELSARGSMESGGKKKKLKENTTAAVGGLGFNTGNPAVDDEKISSYATTNALAQDDENGNLLNMMKKTQSSISNRIGFKAFDPTQKGKK